MVESLYPHRLVSFGNFEVDLQTGELRKAGMRLKLTGQPFQVLAILLERPGDVVTREELQKRLWPDTFVDFDHNLNAAINKIREVLGDSAESPCFVETLPRRGYRFIAPVDVHPNKALATDIALRSQHVAEILTDLGDLVSTQSESSSPVSAATLVNKVSHRTYWAVGLGLAAVGVLVAAAFFTFNPSRRPPRMLGYSQLTSDRQLKHNTCEEGYSSLVTDGPRVFFSETASSVAQVSSRGGDVTKVPVPLPCFRIFDISPDKTELLGNSQPGAYAEDQPLWVLSITSGLVRRVGNLSGHQGGWSPHGREIAFATGNTEDNGNDLYISAVDGSVVRKVARFEKGFINSVRWSPDGKLLRVAVSGQLWELSADDTNPHPMLLQGTSQAERVLINQINWTPDGRYFLFNTVVSAASALPGNRVDSKIWAVRESRSLFGERTSRAIQLAPGPMSFGNAVFSVDGKKIFAVGGRIRGELDYFNLKSGKLEPYLSGISAEQLDFSRDGQWVAYVTFPDRILWRSRLDGTERMQLTNPPQVTMAPHWSPDGTRIAFCGSTDGNHWKIYVVSTAGGTPELVSESNAFDPTWLPDGNSLVFSERFDLPHPRILFLDLRTRHESVIPGPAGLYSPRVSPDGRYIVAIDWPGQHQLLLLDRKQQKWVELYNTLQGLCWPQWSSDSQFVYVNNAANRKAPVVDRIRVADRKLEHVARFEVPEGTNGYWGVWIGETPDGSPLLLRDLSLQEIYALDVDLP